jgi:hypothetical protein
MTFRKKNANELYSSLIVVYALVNPRTDNRVTRVKLQPAIDHPCKTHIGRCYRGTYKIRSTYFETLQGAIVSKGW